MADKNSFWQKWLSADHSTRIKMTQDLSKQVAKEYVCLKANGCTSSLLNSYLEDLEEFLRAIGSKKKELE